MWPGVRLLQGVSRVRAFRYNIRFGQMGLGVEDIDVSVHSAREGSEPPPPLDAICFVLHFEDFRQTRLGCVLSGVDYVSIPPPFHRHVVGNPRTKTCSRIRDGDEIWVLETLRDRRAV